MFIFFACRKCRETVRDTYNVTYFVGDVTTSESCLSRNVRRQCCVEVVCDVTVVVVNFSVAPFVVKVFLHTVSEQTELYTQKGFFDQSILTDRYIHRREF